MGGPLVVISCGQSRQFLGKLAFSMAPQHVG